MKIKNNNVGSTIGIILGVLFFLIPFTNSELISSGYFVSGIILIFGSLSYRNKKKDILLKRKRFPILEIITILLLLLHLKIGFSNTFKEPINFLLVPLWIIIAYMSLLFAKNE